jgi:superfamily I DNA/RNA helicase
VLAYLRVIHSLKDSAALLRIINIPNRRLGKERIAMLVKDAETKNQLLWESVQAIVTGELRFTGTDRAAETGLSNFARCISSARLRLSRNEISSVSELIDYVRNSVQYDVYLGKKFGPEADDRIANLEELRLKISWNKIHCRTSELQRLRMKRRPLCPNFWAISL